MVAHTHKSTLPLITPLHPKSTATATAALISMGDAAGAATKVALDRLATIQSRVQTVITQTYELREYPSPSLFIVLPKTVGALDKITSPFSHQFLLYFLCECGAHTMDRNSMTPHEILLAKHEGYDLEKPSEFFRRYGSWVLALVIKYGVTTAGLEILDRMDSAQQHMDYIKKNIAPLVDTTINLLYGAKRKNEMGEKMTLGHTEMDQLEALQGADLRQLGSYLKVKDKGRVLANLYRMVTL